MTDQEIQAAAVMIPQIDHSYKNGKMPPLLGYSGDK
jgi:hypothetical protein